MFAANQTATGAQKDTTRNVEATGVFCWQLATYDLREYVNGTAQQVNPQIDEFEHVGLEKEDARLNHVLVQGKEGEEPKRIPVPMVKRSPVKFECTYYSTLKLPGNPPMGSVDVVIGRVVGIHIDERVLIEGRIDVGKTVPIARCGYYEYAAVREVFEMIIPGEEATNFGLEGSAKKNKQLQNDNLATDSTDAEKPA
jgi:flavin reductase (DIM6/NTAB) family NADH-FMN oxidoreductase RutF